MVLPILVKEVRHEPWVPELPETPGPYSGERWKEDEHRVSVELRRLVEPALLSTLRRVRLSAFLVPSPSDVPDVLSLMGAVLGSDGTVPSGRLGRGTLGRDGLPTPGTLHYLHRGPLSSDSHSTGVGVRGGSCGTSVSSWSGSWGLPLGVVGTRFGVRGPVGSDRSQGPTVSGECLSHYYTPTGSGLNTPPDTGSLSIVST